MNPYIELTLYYYRIGHDGTWTRSDNNNSVTFNNLAYGSYSLDVKYYNPVEGRESELSTLDFEVKAPIYLSSVAKGAYALIILGVCMTFMIMARRRMRERQQRIMEKMERQHKEAIYEEKLRFFTNITHEFCTPLTLIYGPCERILNYEKSDGYINKYAQLIKDNTEQLNALIQEVIDFRRMETGHKPLDIQTIDISEMCRNVANSFTDLAEQNQIHFESEIAPALFWETDRSGVTKILYNLVSNAFKYAPTDGTVRLTAEISGDNKLTIKVYNTGKGIPPQQYKHIFDRYTVLDNVDVNTTRGLSARNGLGLAIVHNMVKMLRGDITIQSEVGEYAMFIVTLPRFSEAPEVHPEPQLLPVADAEAASADAARTEAETPAPDTPAARPDDEDDERHDGNVILAVDDNPGILSLLTDGLRDYRVITATNADEALSMLKEHSPQLIITDVMMPGTDGMALTKQIKGDRHTMHIPIVILSAKNGNEDQLEGLKSGADVYVSKPFKMTYLRAVVARLLKTRREMREYFNTTASAYEYTEGKLMRKEDKEFLTRMAEYVNANISDTELGVEALAAYFQTSTRNLYRRLKELGQMSPNDYIKYHRITCAAKLLLTTSMTVQEIMYHCGFNNRSHFYREFAKRYGVTPKAYRQQDASTQ